MALALCTKVSDAAPGMGEGDAKRIRHCRSGDEGGKCSSLGHCCISCLHMRQ